jgi:hypothetical protein
MRMSASTAIRRRWIAGAALLLAAAVACATGPTPMEFVRPGANGVHTIRIRSAERDTAEYLALRGAMDYCRARQQEAEFIDDGVTYTGALDETTREVVRQASRAAGAIGASRADASGRALDEASWAGDAFSGGPDYRADATFRCQ